MEKLYTTYILPLLEYASVVWSPHQLGDIELLERVQRRFTKVPRKLRNLSFEERRQRLNLKSLETRRFRNDLIEAYKIVNGIETVIFEAESHGFIRQTAPTAGKRAKLRREVVKSCNQRHNFYNRVVNGCNELPDRIFASESVNDFKKSLDEATKVIYYKMKFFDNNLFV